MAPPRVEVEVGADDQELKASLVGIEAQFDRMNRAIDGVDSAGQKMSRRLSDTTSATRRFGGAIQNSAFQVADFATQVGAGTRASQALGQQLPQLLGAFGVYGAVAGAAAAITVPLASRFIFSSEAAKELSDQIEDLNEQTASYVSSANDSVQSTDDLADKYGLAAKQASGYLVALRELNKYAAEGTAEEAFSEISKSFGDLNAGIIRAGSGRNRNILNNFESGIKRISEELNIAEDDASEFGTILRDLQNAEGLDAQRVQAEKLNDAITAMLDAGSGNDRLREFQRNLAEIGLAAAEIANTKEPSSDSATISSRRPERRENALALQEQRKFGEYLEDLVEASNKRIEAAQKKHEETKAKLRKLGAETELNAVLSSGSSILAAMGANNERALKISQSFAAAEALVNAYRSAAQTLADPTIPWYGKLAAASTALATGIGFVNSIKAISSSGGGGGFSVGSSQSNAGQVSAVESQNSPLQVSLNTVGSGEFVRVSDMMDMFDIFNEEAGNRGLKFV